MSTRCRMDRATHDRTPDEERWDYHVICEDGVAGVVNSSVSPKRCQIEWLEAKPRGAGIGRAALPLIEDHMRRKLKCTWIYIDAMIEAVPFWERMGYTYDPQSGYDEEGRYSSTHSKELRPARYTL